MSTIVNHISYIHVDRTPLFGDVSFSVPTGAKIALIGSNGSGKTTLLRILSGELLPSAGEVVPEAEPYCVPQHFGQYNDRTIADVLGVTSKLNALSAIIAGDASVENFTALNEEWDIEERTVSALASWGVGHLALSAPFATLSGGEKTKVFLAGVILYKPSLILLDEPSNHLDAAGREQLYDFIRTTKATLIVVSHDRCLLNLLHAMYELAGGGVSVYSGDYEFYKERKEEERQALEARISESEKELRKARRVAREVAERKQRQDARGADKQKKQGVARIMMNTLRDKAENSSSRLQGVHAEKIGMLSEELEQNKSQLPDLKELKINFGHAGLHSGKILVSAEEVNFSYTSADTENPELMWPVALNFQIVSGDRIAISGANGSGKTTLFRLILGELTPLSGRLERTDFKGVYVDQEYSAIESRLTVFEQLARYNSQSLSESELKTILHRFLFSVDDWDKKCSYLSGGEKMRLLLCCLMVSNKAPDVFVLDEPTNNLDIRSLEILTSFVREYRGTLFVISHDRYFMDEIGVDRELDMEKGGELHFR